MQHGVLRPTNVKIDYPRFQLVRFIDEKDFCMVEEL